MQIAQEIYRHHHSKSLIGAQQSTIYTNSYLDDKPPGFDISASEIKVKETGSDRYQSEAYLRSFNSSMLDVDEGLNISALGNNILGGADGRKRRTREDRMKNKTSVSGFSGASGVSGKGAY